TGSPMGIAATRSASRSTRPPASSSGRATRAPRPPGPSVTDPGYNVGGDSTRWITRALTGHGPDLSACARRRLLGGFDSGADPHFARARGHTAALSRADVRRRPGDRRRRGPLGPRAPGRPRADDQHPGDRRVVRARGVGGAGWHAQVARDVATGRRRVAFSYRRLHGHLAIRNLTR